MNKPTRYKLCASKFISGFTPIKDVQSRQNGRKKMIRAETVLMFRNVHMVNQINYAIVKFRIES